MNKNLTPSMNEMLQYELKECSECAAKAGTPTLCPSCIENRRMISNLKTTLKDFINAAYEFQQTIEYL